MAETDILPLIIFSLFFGAVLTTIGEKGRMLASIFEAMNTDEAHAVHASFIIVNYM
jgi:Na+/H+-dicarboxylate symporter